MINAVQVWYKNGNRIITVAKVSSITQALVVKQTWQPKDTKITDWSGSRKTKEERRQSERKGYKFSWNKTKDNGLW